MFNEKKIKEAPEWFKLENYREANTLTLRGWFENLYRRRDLLDYFTSMRSGNPPEDTFEDPEFEYIAGLPNEKLFNQILKDPIIRSHNTCLFFDPKPVSPLSISQLVRKYNSIKNKDEHLSFSSYLSSNSSEETPSFFEKIISDTEEGKFLSEPCQDKISNCAYISVNLRASDEHILSDFKNWLAEIRVESRDKAAKEVFS